MLLRKMMVRSAGAVVLAALSAGSSSAGSSALAQEAAQIQKDLDARVVKHVLENGLTVLILPRPKFPTVSFQVYFKVGSVDESSGQSGTAHMYEHMAFMGDTRLGTTDAVKEKAALDRIDKLEAGIWAEKDRGERANPETRAKLQKELDAAIAEAESYIVGEELPALYEKHGGTGLNAFTATDQTAYIVSLPKNKIELWAAVEAGRMTHPVLRRIYRERDVVKEERRGAENSPDFWLREVLETKSLDASPYASHTTIGWMSDLDRVSRPRTEAFFRKFYVPQNIVIAVVGDVKPAEIVALTDKYFERIPGGADPDRAHTVETTQRGERRMTVEYEDAADRIGIAFRRPNGFHKDSVVYDVIAEILSTGRTSRFYRTLVRDKKLSTGVGAYSADPGIRYENLFVVQGTLQFGRKMEDLEEGILKILEDMKNKPVEAGELDKIKNQAFAARVQTLQSNTGMAYQLTYAEGIYGDWRELGEEMQRILAVTPADIQRVAKATFVKNARTVVLLKPPYRDPNLPQKDEEDK